VLTDGSSFSLCRIIQVHCHTHHQVSTSHTLLCLNKLPLPTTHTHTFQYVFLVARQPHLGLSREIRLHRQCPSPSLSIIHESHEHYHLTTNPGCLVKYPRDTLSRYRGTIKYVAGALGYIVRGAGTAASTMANIPSHPASMAASNPQLTAGKCRGSDDRWS